MDPAYILLALFLAQQVADRTVMLWILWLALIFLGLFSLGMLTPYRGILLTLGGFLLVGTFMLAYGKRPLRLATSVHRSGQALSTPTEPEPEPSPTDEALMPNQPTEPIEPEPELEVDSDIPEPSLPTVYVYCPQCGRGLEEAFDYCPGCSYDARQITRCPQCHHDQIASTEDDPRHCVHCGADLFG